MKKVVLKGWKIGLNKVSLNDLLQTHCGKTLAEAKAAVDLLLEGHSFEVILENEETAKVFVSNARSIGVIVDG